MAGGWVCEWHVGEACVGCNGVVRGAAADGNLACTSSVPNRMLTWHCPTPLPAFHACRWPGWRLLWIGSSRGSRSAGVGGVGGGIARERVVTTEHANAGLGVSGERRVVARPLLHLRR